MTKLFRRAAFAAMLVSAAAALLSSCEKIGADRYSPQDLELDELIQNYVNAPYYKLPMYIHETADQLYFSCGGPEANDHFYVFNKTTLQGIHWVHDRKDATALLLAKASDKDFFYYIFNDYNDYIPESLPIEMEPLKRYLIKEKHVNLKGDSINPLIIKIKFQLP